MTWIKTEKAIKIGDKVRGKSSGKIGTITEVHGAEIIAVFPGLYRHHGEPLELVEELDRVKFNEADGGGCSGWRFPKDCPNRGRFDEDSPACKDCVEDMVKAMSYKRTEV